MIVSLPHFNSPGTIRRAVESVLNQIHKNLTLIVIDDSSDPDKKPWDSLKDISDSRLIRFELNKNSGRYFADAVSLYAAHEYDPNGWYTFHDADDAARPNWISDQLAVARKTASEAVFCSHRLINETTGRTGVERPQRYDGSFRHHAHLAGLWRIRLLWQLGGPRPDQRIGWDSMLTGAAMATGKAAIHRGVLYDRYLQPKSLTKSPDTCVGSKYRASVRKMLVSLWPDVASAAEQSPSQAGEVMLRGLDKSYLDRVQRAAQDLLPALQEVRSSDTEISPSWATCLNYPELWGGWALDLRSARDLARYLEEHQPRSILETGSGSSTLLFSQYSDKFGADVLSLEGSPTFQKRTQDLLERFNTGPQVEVVHAPLQRTPEGPWYKHGISPGIDLALIDGPRQNDGGRKAAFSNLIPFMKPGATVLLDDSNRPQETKAISYWSKHFGISLKPLNGNTKLTFGKVPWVSSKNTGGAKLVITLLTGKRPQLLKTTIECLNNTSPGLLNRAHVIAFNNGGGEETSKVLSVYRDVINTLHHTDVTIEIGKAVSLLSSQAQLSERLYWLHLEDDWMSLPITPDWIAQAQDILKRNRNIYQVRLRHQKEFTLSSHMVTGKPLVWSRRGSYEVSPDAHYTLNPSLVRVEDIPKIWPAKGEREAQKRAHASHLRGVARMSPGMFLHTGEENSLRKETGCQV